MQTRDSKRYVILNAALNNSSWYDLGISFLYQASARFFRTKYQSAKIVHIHDRPAFESLSEEDKRAIQEADKILIAGHCYEDDYLQDQHGMCVVDAPYLAELLADAFNGLLEKPRQVSVAACESLLFAAKLLEAFSKYPMLIMIPVTGRKFEMFIDPITGRKFNNLPDNGRNCLIHHTQLDVYYKSRFFMDPVTAKVCHEQIAGQVELASYGPVEALGEMLCQIVSRML